MVHVEPTKPYPGEMLTVFTPVLIKLAHDEATAPAGRLERPPLRGYRWESDAERQDRVVREMGLTHP